MSGITIDASDVLRLADNLEKATPIIQSHLLKGITKAGLLVEGRAKGNAPVKTGHLRRSITSRASSIGGGAQAVVGTNVPYARPVEEGTGYYSIRPRNKKALKFTVGGETVFARFVLMRPRRGQWYMRKAFVESRGEIDLILRKAAQDAAWEVIG